MARFVVSDSADAYSYICREYHLDPAAGLADDFLAHQFRLGLLLRSQQQPEPEEEDHEMREAVRKHHASMQEARQRLGGGTL